MKSVFRSFLLVGCVVVLFGCEFDLERGDGSIEISKETGEVVEEIQEDKKIDSYFNKEYRNEKLGMSFRYYGEGKSYITETGSNALQYVEYDAYDDIEEYYPSPQDYIEVYEKSSEETFEEAMKRLVLEQVASLEDCNFEIEEDEDVTQKLFVSYKEGFVFDEQTCTEKEFQEVGPSCYYRQGGEHTEKAFAECSDFARGMWGNYFIYQPENSKTRVAFIRHVGGIDAPYWDLGSIELFD